MRARAYGGNMRIVHVASEFFPLIKTGGLADAVAGLVAAQVHAGHEVEVFVPGYRALCETPAARSATEDGEVNVTLGERTLQGRILSLSLRPRLTVRLVVRPEFYDREHLYWDGVRDYDDNDARFIFFAKAVVEVLRRHARPADVLHAHDWQAGLTPLLTRYAEHREGRPLVRRTVFTAHNAMFQGTFPLSAFGLTNLPGSFCTMEGLEFYGQMSLLKAGLVYADRVTTVSPNHARELLIPATSFRLDGVLRARGTAFSGILNGMDVNVWNPSTDALLPARYDRQQLAGKAACRAALLQHCGWSKDDSAPLFAMVSRLSSVKGHDLVVNTFRIFRKIGARLILIGSGEKIFEQGFRALAAAAPQRIWAGFGIDEATSHLAFAGADFFLMPSRHEPCGLTPMYAQAYGTVPVAARVGGLVDSVTDVDENSEAGTGLLFAPTPPAYVVALERAAMLHADRARYSRAQQNAMARDFSWEKSASAYEQLYRS